MSGISRKCRALCKDISGNSGRENRSFVSLVPYVSLAKILSAAFFGSSADRVCYRLGDKARETHDDQGAHAPEHNYNRECKIVSR